MSKDSENIEHAFLEQLAEEVSKNEDAISEMLSHSKVGNCGGQCKGWQEPDLKNLCPACLKALEAESDEIFTASPMLRLLGDVMNSKD
jgi:hypothetical protein